MFAAAARSAANTLLFYARDMKCGKFREGKAGQRKRLKAGSQRGIELAAEGADPEGRTTSSSINSTLSNPMNRPQQPESVVAAAAPAPASKPSSAASEKQGPPAKKKTPSDRIAPEMHGLAVRACDIYSSTEASTAEQVI
jgi:hypothetical protein